MSPKTHLWIKIKNADFGIVNNASNSLITSTIQIPLVLSILDETALFDVGLEDMPRQKVVVFAVNLITTRQTSSMRHCHFE